MLVLKLFPKITEHKGQIVPIQRPNVFDLPIPSTPAPYPAGSARSLLRGNAAHHAVANGVPDPRGMWSGEAKQLLASGGNPAGAERAAGLGSTYAVRV